MNKTKLIIFITAVVFVASAVLTFISMKPSEKNIVEVVQDGKIIYTFDLLTAENQEIKIPSPDGKSSNTVTISDGNICISDAECPDKLCVKSGFLKSESMPVVCLPNRLVIRFGSEEN